MVRAAILRAQLWGLLWCLWAPGPAGCPAAEEEAAGAGWTPEALAKRYGLEHRQEEAGGFQLQGSGARVRGNPGDMFLEVNRLRYRLSEPWKGAAGNALGEKDVVGLLDLLLQPARHMETPRLVEVFLEEAEPGKGEAAGKVMAMLRKTLEEYEVKVSSADAGRPEKDFLWLRLREAQEAERDARSSRCLVLAHSNPGESGGGVYPGEFFDAESLILATLIQTGMVLGPGAAGGGAQDGGIERIPLGAFAMGSAPAVCLEWGSGLDPAHVAKSLAAGVLRFGRFLGSEERSRGGPPPFGRREVRMNRVDLREGPGEEEVQLILSVAGKAGDLSPEKRDAIEIPPRFFVRDEDGLIRMLAAAGTRLDWGEVTQVPGDEGAMATLRVVVSLPKEDYDRLRSGFWGYAVWVVREGVVEDRRATPDWLADQLWRWEGS